MVPYIGEAVPLHTLTHTLTQTPPHYHSHRFLASVGEVIYFPMPDADIPWLCKEIIGAIVSPPSFLVEKVERSRGIVLRKNLESVFKGKSIDDIVHILVSLELCFHLDKDGEPAFVLPALLDRGDVRPGSVWIHNQTLTLYFGKRLLCATDQDMLSPGFMPRFQVCVCVCLSVCLCCPCLLVMSLLLLS